MYIKKIIASVALVATVAVSAAMFAAFEAHVINVTAKIENALAVSTEEIEFGTVFPQEILEESLCIELSQSFMEEERVDDVVYVIKQKPKPKNVDPDGLIKPAFSMYKEGGQFYGQLYGYTIDNEYDRTEYCHRMRPVDAGDPCDLYYINCYPILAPYLSKHKADDDDDNLTDQPPYDTEIDAPDPNWETNVADGYLTQLGGDILDHWIIDLVVPCFEGMCDQTYDPSIYGDPLDPRLEHEVFGADLWIEVVSISETCTGCVVE